MNVTDARLEKWVAVALRTGVLLAAAVVLAGGIDYLIANAGGTAKFSPFHGEPAQYRDLRGIFQAAAGGDSKGIIQLGLVLLVATPVVRVGLSLIGFAVERDRVYVTVTAVVLGILIVSLLGKI